MIFDFRTTGQLSIRSPVEKMKKIILKKKRPQNSRILYKIYQNERKIFNFLCIFHITLKLVKNQILLRKNEKLFTATLTIHGIQNAKFSVKFFINT